ncbi:hypothetical protein AZE42_12250 [Rhizopogon vesiculosus]|uniref:Uncharacterized protein n=1 Tax=Rhizopogon vesiculosus TaxID=180088 RepID=A0A1J8Q1C2_9AGAM|nr:hypothetical protein AZE42_12250 [Rhizopogon vesiculosus]
MLNTAVHYFVSVVGVYSGW